MSTKQKLRRIIREEMDKMSSGGAEEFVELVDMMRTLVREFDRHAKRHGGTKRYYAKVMQALGGDADPEARGLKDKVTAAKAGLRDLYLEDWGAFDFL